MYHAIVLWNLELCQEDLTEIKSGFISLDFLAK